MVREERLSLVGVLLAVSIDIVTNDTYPRIGVFR